VLGTSVNYTKLDREMILCWQISFCIDKLSRCTFIYPSESSSETIRGSWVQAVDQSKWKEKCSVISHWKLIVPKLFWLLSHALVIREPKIKRPVVFFYF
jgi:hypothetical protein